MPRRCLGSKVPNWYVITGGPSSGKTTIINELSRLGFTAYPDAARILIDEEIKKGKSIEKIRENEGAFQRKVLKKKIEIEKRAPKYEVVFFDRALPCSVAYYRSCGLDLKEVLKVCQKRRYKKVFFLEQLPFKKDYARIENSKVTEILNKLLKESYENLGYKIVIIPAMSAEERVQRTLKELA